MINRESKAYKAGLQLGLIKLSGLPLAALAIPAALTFGGTVLGGLLGDKTLKGIRGMKNKQTSAGAAAQVQATAPQPAPQAAAVPMPTSTPNAQGVQGGIPLATN